MIEGDESCIRTSSTGLITEKSKCTASQTFDFNVTYFYDVPKQDGSYGFGTGFSFPKVWWKDCAGFMPTGMALDGTWTMDKPPLNKYIMLEKKDRCALQLISLKKDKKLDLTFNDIFYAARDALPILEAGKGRFSVGGMIRCDEDDNDNPDKYTYAWRLTPVATDTTVVVQPYYAVKDPWKTT